jgi:hypothetical protein
MIAIITPTGCRSIQFGLCEHFMKRQTYTGEVVWIIIDDGIPTTTDNVKYDFKDNWVIIKVYPKPEWRQGQNTQFRNMLIGIHTLLANYSKKDIEAIFIIEDDDYYKPIYLERMVKRVNRFDIVGEKNSVYYNVHYRNYLVWANILHASLFQTVISTNAIPVLEEACAKPLHYPGYYIDMQIWGKIKNQNLFNDGNLAIGIKGMPGRFGIGSGHDDRLPTTPDADMILLKKLIGDDYSLYEGYFDSRLTVRIRRMEARRERRLRGLR